mgnify:CR=1 FL=1
MRITHYLLIVFLISVVFAVVDERFQYPQSGASVHELAPEMKDYLSNIQQLHEQTKKSDNQEQVVRFLKNNRLSEQILSYE